MRLGLNKKRTWQGRKFNGKSYNKYGNKKTVVDDIRFDSQKEAKYYLYLKGRLMKKEIKYLELQPSFLLQDKFKYEGKTERSIKYVADFQFIDCATGETVVVDVKGLRTDVYKLKRKWFLFKYPQYKFMEV